MGHVSR